MQSYALFFLQSYSNSHPSFATIKMSSPATTLPPPDALDQFLLHLYTPYGVASLAVIAIILTSLVWTMACCIVCCCRWRQRERQSGDSEASREMTYYGMGSTEELDVGYSQTGMQGGTLSSGYNTGPPASTSSLAQMNTTTNTQNTSMDSLELSY